MKNQIKTINFINWSSKLFHGFYESDLYNSNTLYNMNHDDDVEYDFCDGGFDSFCNDVARGCSDALFNSLENHEIIKSIDFVKLHSPAYYNFSTDKIEMNIDVNWSSLLEYINKNKDVFDEYLKDNFTNYDGFYSFIPNNVDDFLNKLESDFERLSNVLVEFYILQIINIDAYNEACFEIASNKLYEYIEPVKNDDNNQ